MAETFRRRTQDAANQLLHVAGLHLQRADRAFEMQGILQRAKKRGFAPRTIIDVGASDGVWSQRARPIFPEASFLLFEPLKERAAALELLRDGLGFHIVPAAAGREPGALAFQVDADLDGSGVAANPSNASRTVPVIPIDIAVKQRTLDGPYCIKLDTHGFEIPILEGAQETLRKTGLLIIEAYNFQLTPQSLRFHELCAWLEVRGFRCCDLADPMRRPTDGVLWQMDLAFAPASDAIFLSQEYR